jgi:hypothetical protein|tara:strand:- start:382 stop:741 length:360 start_codon:yes stop_codon:yes gene_type:complete
MGKFELPSLILHVDEIIENSLEIAEVIRIEKRIINIIQKELEAEKNNCQIIWVKSKIICSNYKIFGELKFRDKETRNMDKRDKCLKRIGKILQNKFNVFIRLRAFSFQDSSITALDLEN